MKGEIEVRATVRFQLLVPGDVVVVDPSDPYIAKLLSAGWLVPTVPSVEKQEEHERDR